jgi:signal transduction histidine kinase
MGFRGRLPPPSYVPAMFIILMLTLAAALYWLSWRLLQQDRALENQRVRERLAALPDARLGEAAGRLGSQLSQDSLLVILRPDAVEDYPKGRLSYYPVLPVSKDPPATTFAAGETLEFRQKDYAGAIASFRRLALSPDPLIRAGALLRLGRNLIRGGEPEAALAVYDDLGKLGTARIEGIPADLLARRARLIVLEDLHQNAQLRREAERLLQDLYRHRWILSASAYHFYVQEVSQRLGPDSEALSAVRMREQAYLALATAVEEAWGQWQAGRREQNSPSGGARSFISNGRPVLLMWRTGSEHMVALVAGPLFFGQHWLASLRPWLEPERVKLALTDAEGRSVFGQTTSNAGSQVQRSTVETKLPWTVHAASADPAADLAQLAARRRLLLAGLGLMAVVILAGGYFVVRATTRELAVARLQSDFVAAVSHEFRTPLTSMRQIAELFARGRVPDEDRRQKYSEILLRETERLHRLVENLLDFGRMEASAHEYRLEPLDAAALVRGVVDEFQEEVAARDYRIELSEQASVSTVRGDPEALRRALWNLLDNAVKYSPECRTVWVEVSPQDKHLSIAVRDRGLGIPAEEQREVFKKFVRGASSKTAGAKGTGLGLAMVDHIARAHRGKVLVQSEPGAGSTFTLLLPLEG